MCTLSGPLLILSAALQLDREKLQSENTNLVQAFREKSRKHQQTQELYDRLKRKEMTAATQSAAFESVDDVLGNVGNRVGHARPPQQSFAPGQQGRQEASQYAYANGQDLVHQRDGSNGSGGSGGMMPPPPLRRSGAFGSNNVFGNKIAKQVDYWNADGLLASNNPTPSQHRTQLGPRVQYNSQQSTSRNASNIAPSISQIPTSSQRLPLGTMGASSINRSNFGGYGMSAGLKVGRQQRQDQP